MGEEIEKTTSTEEQSSDELDALVEEVETEEASTEEQLPDSLKRFADEEGKLDSKKLADSYLEAEKALRRTQNDFHQQKAAIEALNVQLGLDRRTEAAKPDPEAALQSFVNDPSMFIEGAVRKVVAPIQAESGKSELYTRHPELRDEDFQREIADFVVNLPPAVRALETTVEGADFLVKLYKQNKKGPELKKKIPNTESPTNSGSGEVDKSTTSRQVKRSTIIKLMKENPQEYMRKLPAIEKAYKEGRVIRDI